MGENESRSLEQLANELFDEMGFKEGDECFVDTKAHLPNNEPAEKSPGEQTEKGKESVAEKPVVTTIKEEQTPQRLYAGKYKTPEEMEAALVELQNPKKPEENKLPDLTQEELIVLHEQDEQDGKQWTVGYLQKKMVERNLTDFELEKLKELDSAKLDLYGQYVAAKTKREVYSELQPVLRPVQEEQAKRQYDTFVENEKTINDSNKVEFGEELAELEKKISDPKTIESVLKESPLRDVILNEWNNGSKAMSHKLLLREAKFHFQKQIQSKKEKSVPADVTGASSARKVDKAQTLDEAFDESCRELNL